VIKTTGKPAGDAAPHLEFFSRNILKKTGLRLVSQAGGGF